MPTAAICTNATTDSVFGAIIETIDAIETPHIYSEMKADTISRPCFSIM
jgi:hypothetical protein